jgi:hypothetical protein
MLRPETRRDLNYLLPNKQRVVVFNIGGGAFRLITVIYYNRGIVFMRKFMTHAEYTDDPFSFALRFGHRPGHFLGNFRCVRRSGTKNDLESRVQILNCIGEMNDALLP